MNATLTHADMQRAMVALDAAHNMHGGLTQELRARIFRAIETGDAAAWDDAKRVMVSARYSLWQGVVIAAGLAASDVPTPAQILDGLEYITAWEAGA